MARRKKQAGSAMVEFALTGIPLIFIWIGVVQMALGMWHYHTLQYAIKQAGAYLAVHGSTSGYCKTNNCRVQDVASIMATYAIGVPQASINMTFTPVAADHTTKGTATTCVLNSCLTNATAFPNGNPEFEIKALYQYKNAIAMVAGGSGGAMQFRSPWLPAYTHQVVMY